jgi:hypothetical protein
MKAAFTVKALYKGVTMAIARNVVAWRGQVRLPKPMMDWVQKRAGENFRSVNAEIMEVIREAMQREHHEEKKND